MSSNATIGQEHIEKIKGRKVKGVRFTSILKANSELTNYPQWLGAFGNSGTGSPRVDFENVIVTITLHRMGKKFPIAQDNLMVLHCCTNIGNSLYKNGRYGSDFEYENLNADIATIETRINFPGIYDLRGNDCLEIKVKINDSWAVHSSVSEFYQIDMGGFDAIFPKTFNRSSPTWIDRKNSFIEIDAIEAHDHDVEGQTFYMDTYKIERGRGNFVEYLDDNVTHVQLFNSFVGKVNLGGYRNHDSLRVLESCEFGGDQYSDTKSSRLLVGDMSLKFEDNPPLGERINHFIIYDEKGKDVDSCKITGSLNPQFVGFGDTVIYVERYYSDQRLVNQAESSHIKNINQTRKKILRNG